MSVANTRATLGPLLEATSKHKLPTAMAPPGSKFRGLYDARIRFSLRPQIETLGSIFHDAGVTFLVFIFVKYQRF
jgi:hypothetical protein